MRADGESSSLRNIVRGLVDIRHSFLKNKIKVFLPAYMAKRYLPKLRRKTVSMALNIKGN